MHQHSLRRTLFATVFAVAAPMVPIDFAFAQTGGQVAQLEEIVVTARRIEENLMQVPMAIAAVTAADIEAAGVKDLSALSQYTPGLWAEYGVSGPGSTSRQLTFRGLSVSSGLVFIDGAPYAGSGNPSIGSVERIEVLIGPQSVYFGRSTFSGAVNFVSKEPGDTFKGQINAEYAKFGVTDDSLSLEGPLFGNKLGVRVTAHHYSTTGMWTNNSDTSERQGARREDSLMGTLVSKPTDDLTVKFLLGYQDEETTGMSRNITLFGRDTQPGAVQSLFCNLGGTFGPYWCGALPTADQLDPKVITFNNNITPQMADIFFNNPLNFPTLFDRRFKEDVGFHEVTWMGHLNVDYSMQSGWNIGSITAIHKTQNGSISPQFFRDNRYTVNINYGRVPNVLPWYGSYINQQNLVYDGSQELRLTSPQQARLRGTLGGSYFYTRSPGSSSGGFTPASTGLISSPSRTSVRTPAIFAGLYYDIAERLTLSAEARYQWDRLTAQVKLPTLGPLFDATFKSFSPRVTLDYKYADNSLAYALWSRGYRPGGFNTQLLGQPPSVLAQLSVLGANEEYLQEKLDNYEIGIKSTWLNNRLQTRIAGYYDLWRNGQVSQTLIVTTPVGGVFVAALNVNVGAVDMHGIEFSANAAVSDHLTVAANFQWQQSKITDYVSAITLRINNSDRVNGKAFPKAPIVMWTVTPTYTDHLTGDWDWYARADWKHRGKYYVDVSNVAWISPNDTFDLHFGVKDQSMSFEIYGTNLTNDMHFQTAGQGSDTLCCSGGSTVNGINTYLPDKRSFGVKGSYKF